MQEDDVDVRGSDAEPEPSNRDTSLKLLLIAGIVTVVAWQSTLGRQILYPFTLLATFAHEMGHGLAAVLVGAHFDGLEMYADGSGLAHWRGDVGRLARGLIAAGGLVGPSIFGTIILMLSRRAERARAILYALMVSLLLALIVARSAFAIVFIVGAATFFGGVARFFPDSLSPFLVQLVGVQSCLSVFRDVSYMFSEGALVDGVLHPSDSADIAQALILPYWFWGGLTAAFSFAVLGFGLYVSLRRRPDPLPQPA